MDLARCESKIRNTAMSPLALPRASPKPWRRSRQDEHQRTPVLDLSSHFQVFLVRKLTLRALVARYLSSAQRHPGKLVVVRGGGRGRTGQTYNHQVSPRSRLQPPGGRTNATSTIIMRIACIKPAQRVKRTNLHSATGKPDPQLLYSRRPNKWAGGLVSRQAKITPAPDKVRVLCHWRVNYFYSTLLAAHLHAREEPAVHRTLVSGFADETGKGHLLRPACRRPNAKPAGKQKKTMQSAVVLPGARVTTSHRRVRAKHMTAGKRSSASQQG